MINVTRGQSIDWQVRFKTVDITGGSWSTTLNELPGHTMTITAASDGISRFRASSATTSAWKRGVRRVHFLLTLVDGTTYPLHLELSIT